MIGEKTQVMQCKEKEKKTQSEINTCQKAGIFAPMLFTFFTKSKYFSASVSSVERQDACPHECEFDDL